MRTGKKVGLLLLGCGAFDGTDPLEAILAALAVEEAGHEVVALSLEGEQHHVVDHASTETADNEVRDILSESARIYRGIIHVLGEGVNPHLDALILPGGQGVVKQLLTDGGASGLGEVREPAAGFMRRLHEARCPIGAVSLAEFILSRLFGPFPGGKGCLDLPAAGVLEDPERLLYLTPGQISAKGLPQLTEGMRALVRALLPEADRAFGT